MLQYGSVDKRTVGLLKDLMTFDFLSGFFLVGGTALALYIDRRISVDLDFFTINSFDQDSILDKLNKFCKFESVAKSENTLDLIINYPKDSDHFVKINMLKYPYKLLDEIQEDDKIRIASMKDICVMKLSAISNRGAKKDFYDLFFLLEILSLQEILKIFFEVHGSNNKLHLLKSLVYFDDAEAEPDPVTKDNISWTEVKRRIKNAVNSIK